jgi:hypothetical protein
MDPFVTLGISADSSVDVIKDAWREKARVCHPDVGGTHEAMQQLNEALRLALLEVTSTAKSTSDVTAPSGETTWSTNRASSGEKMSSYVRTVDAHRSSRDVSSFTIDCLPVEAFEALLIASSWHGDVAIDESPYVLEMVVRDPFSCWVRFDILPEAGASMVSITVSTIAGHRQVSAEEVRDLFVDSLNQINWEELHT